MDTIWIDINLGTKEYSDDDDYGAIYIPEIKKRIELTKLSKIVSTGIDDDFKELLYQFGQSLKEIKRIIEIKEEYKK